ncbi:hypothetical protein VTN77DRAFT_1393 [Rasamsonia byssochlamydoides]|uniref:uncharacterized protein n=1 Tax=Rasamsonia byssochlamydoides TaxID=89139 RepID=UPI00374399F0
MKFQTSSIALVLAGLAGCSHAATPDEWAQRSIYQVITDRFARSTDQNAPCNITQYCGGNWAGLVDQLDYIQGMGFTAVQISPINENLPQDTIYGEAFHGYWPQNLYELNSHFGSPDDLKNLSSELHKRGMYLLVDIVANELAYDIGNANMTSTTPIDYSVFVPFNSSQDFEPYCPITDWNNQTQFQTCWLGYEGVATPRLKTTDPNIANTLNQWIKDLVETYDIDGIRVDGAKQIEYSFFQPFLQSAGVYAMAEVDDGDARFTCNYQNLTGGLENYPLYYTIISAFTAGKMADLVSMVGSMRQACSKTQYLANFIENQDNQRFASYTEDLALAKNALAFTILADGIPKVYYGQEQHLTGNYSPYNRQPIWPTNYDTSAPLYTLTATLNQLRNHAISVDSNYVTNLSEILYTDGSTYATRKGPNGVQIVSVLSNQGTHGGPYELSVPGAADPGTNLTEVTTCNITVVAGENGTIVVPMNQGQPRVFFPTFNLNGSGLCGQPLSKATNLSSSGTTTSANSSGSQKSMAEHLQMPIWLTMGVLAMSAVFVL